MNIKILKTSRIIISVFFFLLLIFFFIDFRNTLPWALGELLLYFQFIPSILKFFSFTYLSLGFILVLILTVLYGRVYCSYICPLGTLQDLFIYLKRKFRKNKKSNYTEPHNFLRYSILILTVLFFIFGSIALINLLDPFSNFGRICSNLVRPIYIIANNGIAKLLNYFNNYSLYPAELKMTNLISLLFPFLFLILIIWFSLKHKRLYCNTICPLGSFLGLLSNISVFKLKINKNNCNKCELCVKVCKANCIDSKNASIDMSRCVGCFNCVDACNKKSINYNIISINKKTEERTVSLNRRKFILTSLALFGTMFSFGSSKNNNKEESPYPDNKKPVSPPGSKSLEHFTKICTACHLCISACPTKVIQPSIFEYGLSGILQPLMNFKISFCNFECTVCSSVCPSGAIIPLTKEQKKVTQIGIAVFVEKDCIVYTKKRDCGACSEHCPTKAVKMVKYENGLVIPEVTKELCVGCGACEYACPTKPKAIFVKSNPIHLIAKKPTINKDNRKINYKEDFPF